MQGLLLRDRRHHRPAGQRAIGRLFAAEPRGRPVRGRHDLHVPSDHGVHGEARRAARLAHRHAHQDAALRHPPAQGGLRSEVRRRGEQGEIPPRKPGRALHHPMGRDALHASGLSQEGNALPRGVHAAPRAGGTLFEKHLRGAGQQEIQRHTRVHDHGHAQESRGRAQRAGAAVQPGRGERQEPHRPKHRPLRGRTDCLAGAGTVADISTEAQLFLESMGEYDKQLAEIQTQINLTAYIDQYLRREENRFGLVPANLGVTDPSLVELIKQYNEALLERLQLLRTTNEQNPVIAQAEKTLDVMREAILTSIQSISDGLDIAKADLVAKGAQFNTRIQDVPRQEREYIEKMRRQEVSQTLYVYLLQKKKENVH